MTAGAGLVAVISGPSGVGKSTVIEGLLRRPGYRRSITATTRAPRGAEKDGVDYLFLAREGFEADVRRGRFLEHATVHGNLYGTPRDGVESVLARGEVCLLNIDVQGACSLRTSGLPVVTIFLLPPSLEELERRLGRRGTEDPAAVRRRLETARAEMAEKDRFDLEVVNREVAQAVEVIASFIESRRRPR
ncbi:MAG: guanylate kinase [Planctomycetes bacterium]|nr:guanylate kinase [Planctomycetota bacterium]